MLIGTLVAGRAAEPLEQTFQSAIVAEEVRRDLNAAVRGYEAVIAQVDAQRAIAATAVFRLGECYRKLGRTNEATAQYQRVVRDFPAEATLVRLSRENLLALGVALPAGGETKAPRNPDILLDLNSEDAEIARLRTLFDRSPDLLNAEKGGKTPLIEAAEKGQLAVVKALLGWGVEVNRAVSVNGTALAVAAGNGHKAVVEALLDAKADPNVVSESGGTALGAAVGQGFTAVVDTLLARGAKVDVEGAYPVLLSAVRDSKTALIERLVKAGAEVNAAVDRQVQVSPRGGGSRVTEVRTALEAAVLWGEREASRTLVRLGAKADIETLRRDINMSGPRKLTSEWLDELLAAAPKEGFPTEGLNELMASCLDKAPELIPALLRAGGSADALDSVGNPLLILAAAGGSTQALEALLAAKPEVNAAARDGRTALHVAVLSGDTNSVALLLKAGADPNRLDQRQLTPLEIVRMNLNPVPGRSVPGLPRRPGVAVPVSGRPVPVPMPVVQGGMPGTGMTSGSGGASGASDEAIRWQRLEAMLLAAGAREDIARRQAIHWRIGGQTEPLLRRVGANPPPSLAQLLIQVLGLKKSEWANLNAIRILRLAGSGAEESVLLVRPNWWKLSGCEWSFPAEWGDVVELPELDHVLGADGPGIGFEVIDALRRCGVQQVIVNVKGEAAVLHLLPPRLPGAYVPVADPGEDAKVSPQVKLIRSCALFEVLESSSHLRASSDLSRIRVTRRSAGQSWILNVADDPQARRFWLVDGDVIEVPEKDNDH
jgi:ankyrin repeat protein